MSTGFLITNLTGKFKPISDIVNKNVFKKLYIYISVNNCQVKMINNSWVSKKITDMYSSSFHLFPHLDVRIILNEIKLKEEKLTHINDYNVDVLLVPKNFDKNKVYSLKNDDKLSVVYFDELLDEEEKIDGAPIEQYKNVVLGGTFDRLHAGHKILLSEALLRCSEKLTVGVTDGDMIKGKKLWELIEPCRCRIEAVEKFISEVDTTVKHEVVPIIDMYGPTKSDPNLSMIVVSAETERGGLKVNEERKRNGLNELDIYVVELAEDSCKNSDEEEEKISSSNTRMRLLGTYLKNPELKPNLPPKPYIIGLTGTVASGKSSICKHLVELGAAVIDCDKVAHELYKPGTEIYFELIKIFGNSIVSENKEINRKELGAIVFNDTKKLEILNNLLWPAIVKASIEKCQKLYEEDKKEIIFLEAAVLLRAGWQKNVHEVWATIIPQSEAIERLMKRNNLTEEEAKSRIAAQPTNTEIVEVANVIFCSLWSYETTWSQVDKAWEAVQNKLKSSKL